MICKDGDLSGKRKVVGILEITHSFFHTELLGWKLLSLEIDWFGVSLFTWDHRELDLTCSFPEPCLLLPCHLKIYILYSSLKNYRRMPCEYIWCSESFCTQFWSTAQPFNIRVIQSYLYLFRAQCQWGSHSGDFVATSVLQFLPLRERCFSALFSVLINRWCVLKLHNCCQNRHCMYFIMGSGPSFCLCNKSCLTVKSAPAVSEHTYCFQSIFSRFILYRVLWIFSGSAAVTVQLSYLMHTYEEFLCAENCFCIFFKLSPLKMMKNKVLFFLKKKEHFRTFLRVVTGNSSILL